MPTLKAIHICNSHKPTLQPKIAKEYVFANADRNTYKRMKIKTKEEHRSDNKVLPKWREKCYFETFVLNSTAVFLMNFSAVNPPLRQYPKR